MGEQILIQVSEEMASLLKAIKPRHKRNQAVEEALKSYLRPKDSARLKRQIKEGAIKRARRDRKLSGEWFALENERSFEAQS